MIYGMVVLVYLVICGPIAPVADEGLVWRGFDGLNANGNWDLHYHYNPEGGLSLLHLNEWFLKKN